MNSCVLKLLALLSGLMVCAIAGAATYTLPAGIGSAPFGSCSLSSGTTYNCTTSISISNNDTVNFTSSMTLNVSGNFTVGNNDTINNGGNLVTINATGNIQLGNSNLSGINFTAGGNFQAGNTATINGNISAGGNVSVGNNGTINGNVTAGGSVSLGGGTVVNGSCSPSNAQCSGRNISIAPVTVAEGNSGTKNLTFTVMLSSAYASNVTFNYATSNGTATGGASCTGGVDYISASGGGTITAGSTTTSITIQVCGDTTKEANETFNVTLSSPVNAVLGTPSVGIGTIDNDDALADYHFDECSYNGTSGEVVDTRGSYPATSRGAIPTTQASGKVGGRSLNLNALNKYVTPNAKIPLPGDYSVSFWMTTPLPAPGGNPIYSSSSLAKHTDNLCYGDILNFRSDASYVWRVYRRSTGGLNGTYSISSLSAGWHHFVVTATGSTSTLYVDGVNRGTVARRANGDRTDLGLGFIGGSCDDPNLQSLRTPIDEFMVFDTVLSSTSVSSIYTNQLAGNNYDGTARTAASCAGLDHIRIEHDGSGNTCSAETLTVKACANAACSSLYTATAVTGNVTWSGSPAQSIAFTIPVSSGSTTVSLPVASVETASVGTSSVSPTPTNASDCLNTSNSSASCSIAFTSGGSCFDAVEVGAAKLTPIYTKLSGTSFNLDVVTTSGSAFTGTVQVSLVDPTAASGNCSDLNAGLTATGNVTFSGSTRQTVSFSYPQAAKDVKVRMRNAATSTPGCSSDNFAIRPSTLVLSATGMNPASDKLKAGGTNFTLSADPGVTAGYVSSGFPALDETKVTDHTGAAIGAGWLTGSFTTGSGGIISGSAFKYNEVGTFTLGTDTFVDSAFTAVDQVTGVVSGVDHGVAGDCTASSTSNSLSSGRYGCNIGSGTLGPLGRFTPNHYQTVVTQGCVAGSFTYSEQPFSVQVTAHNSAGAITTRYDHATSGPTYVKGVTLSSPAVSGSVTNGTVAANLFSLGGATVTNAPVFTFGTVLAGPESIAVRATDSDGISSSDFSEGNVDIRSGRLRLQNAYGSELLALPIPLSIQYWDTPTSAWVANGADSCTAIAASDFALAFPAGTGSRPNNLGACEIAVTVSGSAPNYSVNLSKPGAGNSGWADVRLNLGAAASGSACAAVGAGYSGVASTANTPWLQYNWAGSVADPAVRATFGIYKSPLIYMRENF